MKPAPLMIDIEGTELTDEDRIVIANPLVGGIILFSRNYNDSSQLKSLTESIKTINPNILIAADQEGGRVQRFKNGFSLLPSHGEIGELYDQDPEQGLKLAFDTGCLMARELLDVGVELSFAPVVDLNWNKSGVIGDRSFHSDPRIVTLLAEQFIEGMRHAGMNAVIKHAPGHGYVSADTHKESAKDPRSLDEIKKTDLMPFRDLIKKSVYGLMFSHVVYSEVDLLPASVSKVWHELLRTDMQFEGMIFTDALDMSAMEEVGDFVEVTKMALEAGSDMALLCNNRAGVKKVLDDGLQEVINRLQVDGTSSAKTTFNF